MEMIKICPKCNTAHSKLSTKCPVCGYEKTISAKEFFWFLFFVIFVFSIFMESTDLIGIIKDNLQPQNRFEYLAKKRVESEQNTTIVSVPINQMTDLTPLSKKEILELRKNVVKNSTVFSKIKNYTPNPDVYRIEEGLPWISAYEAVKYGTNSKDISKGPSRSSVLINNPELLFSFLIPEYNFAENAVGDKEPNDIDYMIPKKITWDEKNRTIRVYFNLRELLKRRSEYTITFYADNTNAMDFGYNWAWCEKNLGAKFISEDNITKRPQQIYGCYRKGYACGVEGGCNNYSPQQNNLYFNLKSPNTYLRFKFWKKKPFSKNQKADIYYEMWFD